MGKKFRGPYGGKKVERGSFGGGGQQHGSGGGWLGLLRKSPRVAQIRKRGLWLKKKGDRDAKFLFRKKKSVRGKVGLIPTKKACQGGRAGEIRPRNQRRLKKNSFEGLLEIQQHDCQGKVRGGLGKGGGKPKTGKILKGEKTACFREEFIKGGESST